MVEEPRSLRLVVTVCLAALALAACGSTRARHTKAGHTDARTADARPRGPVICLPAALDAMARFLSVAPGSIATARSTGNNAEPQCTYTTHEAAGRRVVVIANVDNSPSPYFRLERTIVEASQVFGTPRLSPAPVAVMNLGLEASWFPAYSWLMSTDGTLLITATVHLQGAKTGREIALGEAVTRPYLHTPTGKAAQERAMGYPSG